MKRFLSLILALVMLLLLPSAAFAVNDTNVSQIIGDGNTVVFIDVGPEFWAYNEIMYAAQQDIVSGYPDGSFKPEGGVTREEFCKMMVLTFRAPLLNPSTPTFTDVSPSRWSYQYIETCRDFLSGYSSPFDGSMTFHPSEAATREDIAVALVKMMGLRVTDDSYAQWKFSDYNSISPGLRQYVSAAAENGLINGYPDGTFGPQRGITRAETVSLLNRASKTTVGDATSELSLGANVVYDKNDPKKATIYISSDEDITVTIDGISVRMDEDYYSDGYTGVYQYTFTEEGEKTFTVTGTKGARSKTVTVTAQYVVGAPTLTVNQTNQTVTKKDFTLSGTASDSSNSVTLTMNGENVNVGYSGSWTKNVTLSEGANVFTFVATNAAGKSTTRTVTITFDIGGPSLTVNQADQTVTNKDFTLSGTAFDSNYSVTLTMNGGNVNVGYSGSWTKNVTLSEGANVFTFVATNTAGKSVTKTVTITFTVGGPSLTVNQTDQTVTNKDFTLSGSVSDSNYSVTLTMNGENVSVSYSGSWTKSVTLSEGANVFTFVATNTAGKSVTKTVTITFTVGGPSLTVNQADQTVANKDFTLSGLVSDSNYSVTLTMNGGNVNVSYGGSWTKNVTLSEGANVFTFVATNAAGKSVTKTVTITLEVSAPTITFINCPETTSQNSITIIGNIGGNISGIYLFVNDQQWSVNSYDGSFQRTVSLSEGENVFVFRAVNSYAKEVTVTRTITYTAP